MRLTSGSVLVLAFIAVTTTINSAHASRAGVVDGAGMMPCGDYLKALDDKNTVRTIQATEWVSGFVSGYNLFATGKQIIVPDHNTTKAFIDKSCRDNPLFAITQTGFALIKELGGDPTK